MDYLKKVRLWSEEEVGEWLESNNFGDYMDIFKENNINGDILLECNAAVLKELGVKKLGDRIRLSVCIKGLREKCIESARKSKMSFLMIDNQIQGFSFTLQSPTDPLIPVKSSELASPTSNFQLDNSYSDACCFDSLNNFHSVLSNISCSTKSISRNSSISTQKVFEKSPIFLETNVMQSDSIKKNCLKFIGEKGQTRIVNISLCYTADAILSKALKKFNITENPSEWRVFITNEDGSFECISNDTLLTISRQLSRPERERLILKRKSDPLTQEEFKKSQTIAREQRDAIYHTAVMAKTSGNLRKLETFFGEKLAPTLTSSFTTPLPSPLPKDNKYGNITHIRNFFGQRPPSELINSNLAEYFPGHEKKVLEQTIKNSIKSNHLNSFKGSNFDTPSSTLTYDLSSIPAVGEERIQYEGRRLSGVSHTLSLSRFISTRFPTLLESSILRENSSHHTLSSSSKLNSEGNTQDSKPSFRKKLEEKASSDETFKSESPNMLMEPSILSDFYDASLETDRDLLDDNIFENNEAKDFNTEKEIENNNSGPTRWIKGALIGSGSFGSVFLGMNALSGELMAVKQVEIPSIDIQGCKRKRAMLDALQREISLLKELHHENIVQYLGSSMDETHLTFFLEYVPGGSVTALLNNYGAFEEPLIRNFVRQILKGLNYLHNKKIIHRDIKGANILVDNKGGIKISDFGISKKVEANLLSMTRNQRPSLQGSVYWMAPEVVKQTLYTRKADIWSLGCLIVEMFTGKHPFPKMNQLQAIFKIGQYVSPDIPEHCTSEARHFLEKIFEPDYHARPTAADLLKYSFLGPMVSSPLTDAKK
ncbi:hypothetical protein T552_01502 [Pneumocystis carinii B80]|uniref:mitogen-activated protein kinase kinase kinase n=2 Tax=Pneumocystis carinii TaxID=4754 RepID=A0A0W4ZKH0_PNEC8|nr:hypothetical protein T552_01502 [Pneumocystis carinii B80]AAG30572.1 mekk [Pneumocystis carinii]KTW28873.1 hypothetical protein T552_01502 [Pneumocystis carinii B80]